MRCNDNFREFSGQSIHQHGKPDKLMVLDTTTFRITFNASRSDSLLHIGLDGHGNLASPALNIFAKAIDNKIMFADNDVSSRSGHQVNFFTYQLHLVKG